MFCCKLGGPKLSRRDTNRLKQAGYKTSEFLNADDKSLRSKADGSCIFLSIDTTTQLYKCSVYSLRPTLCRLYPFHFEKSGHNSYNLILIPCCNGLNTEEGDSIDMNFLAKTVECTFSEMVDAGII